MMRLQQAMRIIIDRQARGHVSTRANLGLTSFLLYRYTDYVLSLVIRPTPDGQLRHQNPPFDTHSWLTQYGTGEMTDEV